jgi:hypothetical protein
MVIKGKKGKQGSSGGVRAAGPQNGSAMAVL